MLDVAGTHVVTFRSVAWLFGVLCCGDLARKLRLFYYLHLAFPPKLDEVDRAPGIGTSKEHREGSGGACCIMSLLAIRDDIIIIVIIKLIVMFAVLVIDLSITSCPLHSYTKDSTLLQ